MKYRFRLTFYHSRPGLFRFEEQSRSFSVGEGIELTVVARDAESLAGATRYHMEACNFPDEKAAWCAGERLRLRLRVLGAMLGLKISVPTKDTTSGRLSAELRKEMQEKHGAVVLDTIVGLAVFPDDQHHFEMVMDGQAQVFPEDPTYLFTALSEIWPVEMSFDERSQDSLEILGHAMTETSRRSKFLLTYLAVERMVERSKRSEAAIELIKQFQNQVRGSRLEPRDADSLIGALAQLYERSFSSALSELGQRIQAPETFCDKSPAEFLSLCIETRNRIVHNASTPDGINLDKITEGLRKFCLMFIWTHNQIPAVSVDVPGSVVSIPKGGLRFRVI